MKHKSIILLSILIITTGVPEILSADEETYMAVFLEGKKVGYSIETRTVADGKVESKEDINITISRLSVPITLRITEKYIETTDGKPLEFESIQDLGAMVMKTSGKILRR